ncbi:hypothetical protein PG985_005498 [Apiospora marii]|uniref:uncharacterized protein n=1 Tax=Apiospora marii TaxID=335849 RepID=UPI00312F2AEE
MSNFRFRSPMTRRPRNYSRLKAIQTTTVEHIKTKRPAKTLDHKLLGPFQVIKAISPTAVRLKLPKAWRIHNSFHVSLIEPYRAGNQELPHPDQVLRDVGPIEAEDHDLIESIKDSLETQGRVKYLVKWKGWPAKRHWTWEPYDHFLGDGAKEDLVNFHRTHPDKPRDERVEL